jgi:hypothetical protein
MLSSKYEEETRGQFDASNDKEREIPFVEVRTYLLAIEQLHL